MEEGIDGEIRASEKKKIPSEKLLADKEKGKSLVQDVKKAVFDEYDRALLEGTATEDTKEQVQLQKKHTEVVVALSKEMTRRAIEVLETQGKIFTSKEKLAAERTVEIYAYLHDVLKIVPERTKIVFPELEEIREQLEKLERELSEEEEQGELLGRASGNREELERLKLLLEEGLNRDLREYEEQFLEHSGEIDWRTRLLLHGEDSAEWAKMLLRDLGFGPEFIKEIEEAVRAHMPMAFMERQLELATQMKASVLEEITRSFLLPSLEAASRGDFSLAAEKMAKYEEYKSLVDKKIILPKYLDKKGKYPQPRRYKQAALLGADFLSPMVMAGEHLKDDLEKNIKADPEGGCLDRYTRDALSWGQSLEEAFKGAFGSLKENVGRLCSPPDEKKRPEAAMVERVLGEEFGRAAIKKIEGFIEAIEQGIEIEVEEMGKDKEMEMKLEKVRGFKDLEVRKKGISEERDKIDIPATMSRYYKAVDAYRKIAGLDPSDIMQR